MRCGRGLRNDMMGSSALDVAMTMDFKRGSRRALRRSVRSTQISAHPRSVVEPKAATRIWSNNSNSPDAESNEQVSVEAKARCTNNEVRTHSGRFEYALDKAVAALAAVLKRE